jgi:hypothetical protein
MADKPLMSRKFNQELDLGRKIKDGGIHARIYVGVQGNDLKTTQKALENTLYERLNAEEYVSLLQVNMYDILKEKKGAKGKSADLFSGVAEVELVADDFRYFINMIFRYGPSAVEIIEPSVVRLDSEQMHSMVADVSDFAHVYSQQILAMLKDPERRRVYEEILKGGG